MPLLRASDADLWPEGTASLEGKRCAECNGPTEDVGLIRARDLVAARRRFDKQKAIRKAVSDLGIRETVT